MSHELLVVDGYVELMDHFSGWKLKAKTIVQKEWGQRRACAHGEADSTVLGLCKLDKNVLRETVAVGNVTGKADLTIAATWHARQRSVRDRSESQSSRKLHDILGMFTGDCGFKE